MKLSTQFRNLERRIKQLGKHFLPRKFSPTGDYSDRQLDMAMAFRLLCHAEIEFYIEELSRMVVLNKVTQAKENGKSTLTILTLLAYYKTGWIGLIDNEDESLKQKKQDDTNPYKQPLKKILEEATKEYLVKIINNNHGIKTENLQKLLKPTGFDFESIDLTWLTAIDEFGKQRGATAHTSSVGVTRTINPQDESGRISLIIDGFREIDKKLMTIHHSKS